ncbi:MAG: HAMP domain-containing histidine kinase [Brockia lithotrophica]|nr:HAMP domain-containing histidine kinase [Brockia lithotrophica]
MRESFLRLWHRLSFRHRLALALTAVLLALYAVVASVLYLGFAAHEWSRLDASLARTAVEIARSARVTESLLLPYQAILLPDVDVFSFPNTFIEVVRPDGRIVARSLNLGDAVLPPPPEGALGEERYYTERVGEASFRVFALPLRVNDQVAGTLLVAASQAPVLETLAGIRLLLVLAGLFLAVGVAAQAAAFARRALAPVEAIAHVLEESARTGNFSSRIPYAGPEDEIGRLVVLTNRLLSRVQEAQAELEEALARERQFVGDVSHALRTPLTALRGNADLLARALRKPGDGSLADALRELVDEIGEDVERLVSLVDRLLSLARAASGEAVSEPFFVADHLEAAWEGILRRAGAPPTTRLEVAADARRLLVRAPAWEFEEVLVLLLENAAKYAPDRPPRVTLRRGNPQTADAPCDAGVVWAPEAPGASGGVWAELDVWDEGPGIHPDELPHVFRRFVRGRATGSIPGSGLGLALVRDLARHMGAYVRLTSRPGSGTRATLYLPAEEADLA